MPQASIETRTLGKSGIRITSMGLGLWAAGGDGFGATDDVDSLAAIEAALARGINFFDTADVYGFGHSEELLGQAMKGRRDRFIIATKIGWMGFDGEKNSTAYTTVPKLVEAVELALTRLGTDHIDLMQSHIHVRDATMEVFLDGFQRLQEEGKIRAYGVSTSDLEYLKAFNADNGCAALQTDYSILNRTAEQEIFPYCGAHDIGVIVRGPIAMGILAGKFTAESAFGEKDFRAAWQDDPERHRQFLDDLETVGKLRPLARGKTLAQLALQFSMHHPAVTTTIPGAKTVEQVNDNSEAAFMPPLTGAEVEAIDAVVPPGGGRKIWPA